MFVQSDSIDIIVQNLFNPAGAEFGSALGH